MCGSRELLTQLFSRILVDEAALEELLDRRDDAILDRPLHDDRTGVGVVVLRRGNAGDLVEAAEPRVEARVVVDLPVDERLAEHRVLDEESADPVHHAEFLPRVVRVVEAVVSRFDVGDGLGVAVPTVLDARLGERGDQRLLAVPGRVRPVVPDLAEEAELTREHPLVLPQRHREVSREVPDVLREDVVARQIPQDVPRRHRRLVPTAGPGDLRRDDPILVTVGHEGEGEVHQGVVAFDFAYIRIVLDDRLGVRVP